MRVAQRSARPECTFFLVNLMLGWLLSTGVYALSIHGDAAGDGSQTWSIVRTEGTYDSLPD